MSMHAGISLSLDQTSSGASLAACRQHGRDAAAEEEGQQEVDDFEIAFGRLIWVWAAKLVGRYVARGSDKTRCCAGRNLLEGQITSHPIRSDPIGLD